MGVLHSCIFGSMGWDLNKELGLAKMDTQLQLKKQVQTIFFMMIPTCKNNNVYYTPKGLSLISM
jgi:hypothetical protein